MYRLSAMYLILTACDSGVKPSVVEPGAEVTYDNDGDGYTDTEDCDDANPLVYPSAPEICDGVDNNCDGTLPTDEDDADGDGYGSMADDDGDGFIDTLPSADMSCDGPLEIDNAFDCNDADGTVNPGATEVANDGIDQDCDGQDLVQIVDFDSDGYFCIRFNEDYDYSTEGPK